MNYVNCNAQQYGKQSPDSVLIEALAAYYKAKEGRPEEEARVKAEKKMKESVGEAARAKLVQFLKGQEDHGKLKVIKIDPSRPIRYISIRHINGLQIKGLRLIDDDDVPIVDNMWYAKNSTNLQEEGQWSVPMEVPAGMEICGIKTNASSGDH